ncbi:hypothetical protein, partial [Xenorhabdus nematophila]|uniref:hypothetical protein n=1 Tax=Xenorhabdus nematophila TaxID=628 RepID=UPI001E36AA67
LRSLASSVARICNFFSSIFSPVLVDKLNIPKTGNYTNSGTGSKSQRLIDFLTMKNKRTDPLRFFSNVDKTGIAFIKFIVVSVK